MLDNISSNDVPVKVGGTTLPIKRLSIRSTPTPYELWVGAAADHPIAQVSVPEYLKRTQAAGGTWTLPEG